MSICTRGASGDCVAVCRPFSTRSMDLKRASKSEERFRAENSAKKMIENGERARFYQSLGCSERKSRNEGNSMLFDRRHRPPSLHVHVTGLSRKAPSSNLDLRVHSDPFRISDLSKQHSKKLCRSRYRVFSKRCSAAFVDREDAEYLGLTTGMGQ